MVLDKISGSSPDRNIDMDAEPNSSAVALECFSGAQMPSQNFKKSTHGFQKFRKPENIYKDLHAIVEDRSALCQGFSIREYVRKVRGVDIIKCWPLSESLLEDRLREGRNPPLPPLESPNYKWWACQHCLKNVEEQKHCEILFDRQQIVNPERENNTDNIKEMIDKELNVSLETFPEADPGIIQELEEQISKLRPFQISAQEEKIVKGQDIKRGMESNEQRSDNVIHNFLQPTVKGTAGKPGISTKGHKRGKSDISMQKAQENQNQSKEFDSTLNKASSNQNQVQNYTFNSMQTDCELLNGAYIREDTEEAQRVRAKAQDAAQAKIVSTECKRNKSDNLNFEAIKCDSVKHGISDINNGESFGLKICPFCKTFTSTTITAVNAHMGGCLAQASKSDIKQGKKQKQQSRARKKRSIVEICAVSPVVEISVNDVENSEMVKSESLQSIDICSEEVTANLKWKKVITTTEAGAESVVANDISDLRCERKETTKVKASSLLNSAKAKKRQTGKLQTKVRWEQASKDVEEPKMSSAPCNCIETDDDGEQHQPKRSNITVEAGNSNVEHQSCMQGNLELNSGLLENNEHQQFGSLVDHFPIASVLPTENKEDSISTDSPGLEESERVIEYEPTGGPSSVVTVATANAPFHVCHSDRTEDTVIPQNQSSQSGSEKSDLLANNEPTHDKAGSADSSRIQVKEQSEPQYPHSPKLSKQNPPNMSKNQLKSMYSKPKCCFIHTVEGTLPPIHNEISDQGLESVKFKHEFAVAEVTEDQQSYAQHNVSHGSCDKSIGWEKENSKGLHCLQMEGPMSDTRKAGEGHINNAGFDLNQKACVLPRDARGRFIISAKMNGEKESDIPGPQSKETQNLKSSIKRNTSTIHNEANFAVNAALFNARTGKSSSMQTFNPAYEEYHSGKNSAAQEVLFSYPGVERLTAVREALYPTAELSHLEAPSSLNAMNHVKFCMPRQCSNYGYIGLPLDSQGELVKHFPNMGAGVNQVHKFPNYATGYEHLVTESTKMLQKFNFIESMKTSNDVHSVKRPDHWQEYSVSTTNQSRDDRTGIRQPPPLDQIQRDRAYCESSHIRIVGSSSETPNTSSDPRLCMQASAEYGYHGDQKQKASALEKSYPEVHNTRKENSTTQPVIRLMGQSFTVEGENKAVKAVKDSTQGNVKNIQSIPRGTGGVSSSIQMAAYVDHCNTCNEGQFYQPASGVNTSCQDPGGKTNASKDLTESNPSELVAIHNCTLKDESNSAQAWISSSLFCVSMAISPVCPLSTNTCVKERQKLTHKDSYITDTGCLQQKQTYNQLLNSCLGQNRFQKPEYNCWMYTSNPCSGPIQSELVQLLPSATSCLKSISDPSHNVTCATVRSSSLPTETLCQPTASSMFIANCANLKMHGKRTCSLTDESERKNAVVELPKNMNRKRFKTSHDKGRLIDIVDPESKCKDDSRTRKSVEGEEGLHRKWTLEMNENYGPGTLQKPDPFSESEPQEEHKGKNAFHQEISSSLAVKQLKSREIPKYDILLFKSGEIHKSIDSRIEFVITEGTAPKKQMDNDCILNAQSHNDIPQKCQAKETEAFTGPNARFLESETRPSTIGLPCLNAVSPFRLAEPIKLSGGAKHILKPSQNGGQKQSLPIHYTLPFSIFSSKLMP